MLTADLMRVRITGDRIMPRYIDTEQPRWQRFAEALCTLFEESIDQRRAAVDEAVDALIGDTPSHKIARGLAKLLDDRSTWETVAPRDPTELRRAVFEAAAAAHPIRVSLPRDPHEAHEPPGEERERTAVLGRVARSLDIDTGTLESALYADRKDQQRLVAHRRLDPETLLHRYNLALAQGVVLHASELRVEVEADRPARLRELMRYVRFYQLMFRAERASARRWRLVLDGPTSLFQQSQKYGLQLANLLAAIPLLDSWHVDAEIKWRRARQPLRFELDHDGPVRTHLRSRGTWVTDEEKMLRERLTDGVDGWVIDESAEIIDLDGEDVVVPDLSIVHTESGRRAHVVLLGFWRRSYVERKLTLLREHGPPNLILCVSRHLAAEETSVPEATADEGAPIIEFARVVSTSELTRIAELVGR